MSELKKLPKAMKVVLAVLLAVILCEIAYVAFTGTSDKADAIESGAVFAGSDDLA